ncbi:MAG: hypothetical protein R3Y43_05870 [Alphaproteobacteria bacterium]
MSFNIDQYLSALYVEQNPDIQATQETWGSKEFLAWKEKYLEEVRANPSKDEALSKVLQEIEGNYNKLTDIAANSDVSKGEELNVLYDSLDIQASKEKDEKSEDLTTDSFKQNMLKLAELDAVAELSVDENFSKMSAEDQKKAYDQTFVRSAQESYVSTVATQMTLNQGLSDLKGEKNKDAVAYMGKVIESKGAIKPKISQEVAVSSIATKQAAVEEKAKKTGLKGLWDKVKNFDKDLTEKYGAKYTIAKSIATTGLIGAVAGPVGLAAFSAYKTGQTIKKSVESFNDKKEKGEAQGNYLQHLWKNPSEMVSIGVAVAGTVVSAVSAGTIPADQALGALGGLVTDTSAVTEGASEVVKQGLSGKNVARAGIAITSGLNSGISTFAKSFKEKDPEKRKAIRKQALMSAGGAFLGAGAALFGQDIAEAVSENETVQELSSKTGGFFSGLKDKLGLGNNEDTTQASSVVAPLDRDGDGIPDTIDRDAGEGWANGETPEAVVAPEIDYEMQSNEVQLNRMMDANPKQLNEILQQTRGEEYSWMSSAKLKEAFANGEFSQEELKAFDVATIEDFDTGGHITEPSELNDVYGRGGSTTTVDDNTIYDGGEIPEVVVTPDNTIYDGGEIEPVVVTPDGSPMDNFELESEESGYLRSGNSAVDREIEALEGLEQDKADLLLRKEELNGIITDGNLSIEEKAAALEKLNASRDWAGAAETTGEMEDAQSMVEKAEKELGKIDKKIDRVDERIADQREEIYDTAEEQAEKNNKQTESQEKKQARDERREERRARKAQDHVADQEFGEASRDYERADASQTRAGGHQQKIDGNDAENSAINDSVRSVSGADPIATEGDLADEAHGYMSGSGSSFLDTEAREAAVQSQLLSDNIMDVSYTDEGLRVVKTMGEDNMINYQFFNNDGQEVAPSSDYFGTPEKQAAYEQAYADRTSLEATGAENIETSTVKNNILNTPERDKYNMFTDEEYLTYKETGSWDFLKDKEVAVENVEANNLAPNVTNTELDSGVRKVSGNGVDLSYSISEEGRTEISGSVSSVNYDGNKFVSSMSGEMSSFEARNLMTNDMVAQDLEARIADGYEPNAGEARFLESHEKKLENIGVSRNEDGDLVKMPKEASGQEVVGQEASDQEKSGLGSKIKGFFKKLGGSKEGVAVEDASGDAVVETPSARDGDTAAEAPSSQEEVLYGDSISKTDLTRITTQLKEGGDINEVLAQEVVAGNISEDDALKLGEVYNKTREEAVASLDNTTENTETRNVAPDVKSTELDSGARNISGNGVNLSYSISEEGEMKFSGNVSSFAYDGNKLSSKITSTIYQDDKGTIFVGGDSRESALAVSNNMSIARSMASSRVTGLITNDMIAQDLEARVADGYEPNAGETRFLARHEENLEKHGLSRNKDGDLEFTPPEEREALKAEKVLEGRVAKLKEAMKDGTISAEERETLGLSKADVKALESTVGSKSSVWKKSLTPEEQDAVYKKVASKGR